MKNMGMINHLSFLHHPFPVLSWVYPHPIEWASGKVVTALGWVVPPLWVYPHPIEWAAGQMVTTLGWVVPPS